MLNKNQNNHGHLFVKVSAALAAMAIVSATSVEMYQIFGENKNMTSAQNQTSVTTNDTTNTDSEKTSTSTASSKVSGASWVNLAAPSDALTIPEIVEKAMPSAVGIMDMSV